MEIIIGKTAGFCYGVKRAVEGAEKELINVNEKLFCLGEIVHNKQVIDDLKNKGLLFTENINNCKRNVIIRAHGIPKEIYKKAEERRIKLKDYTCPNVLKIHNIAEEYSKKGYFILLCGDKKHPENIGTISYCNENYFVIEDENSINETIRELKNNKINKFLLISQTTFSLDKFKKIEEKIKTIIDENIELIVKNTICKATEIRQKETKEISKIVDYMIIIGGKNSSNTKKLYDIAKSNCKKCILIETENEINLEDFKKVDRVGIMAGASTRKESIQYVYDKLNLLKK